MAVFAVPTSVSIGQSQSIDSTAVTRTVQSALSKDTLVVHHDTLSNSADTFAARKDTLAARRDTLDIITSNETLNTIPGFRVQLMSTQDLSEAIDAKARADGLLNSYNVYIIYDSPYYKVRAGDFRARYDANQAADYIAAHGFHEAWLVPDNVFRNPGRKNGLKDSIAR